EATIARDERLRRLAIHGHDPWCMAVYSQIKAGVSARIDQAEPKAFSRNYLEVRSQGAIDQHRASSLRICGGQNDVEIAIDADVIALVDNQDAVQAAIELREGLCVVPECPGIGAAKAIVET